jgi:hypothetical protein
VSALEVDESCHEVAVDGMPGFPRAFVGEGGPVLMVDHSLVPQLGDVLLDDDVIVQVNEFSFGRIPRSGVN